MSRNYLHLIHEETEGTERENNLPEDTVRKGQIWNLEPKQSGYRSPSLNDFAMLPVRQETRQ